MSARRAPAAAAALGYWAALPVLVVASMPVLVVAVACAGAALGGAPVIAGVGAAVGLGPAWALLAAVAHAVVLAEATVVRALPRVARATFVPGLRLGAVPAVAALLVAASLSAADAEPLFVVPLAVNVAALGGALIVAPFAFAALAAGAPDARAAWCVGAGVAAASPRIVIGTLAALVLVGTAARLAGTGLLLLVPAPLAVVAACATAAVLGRVHG
jgi:hypothetical protein